MNITKHNIPSWCTPYHHHTGKLLPVSDDRSIDITHSRSDSFKGWRVYFMDSTEVENEVKHTCYFDEPGQEAAPYNSVIGIHIQDKMAEFATLWMRGDALSELVSETTGWTSSYSG